MAVADVTKWLASFESGLEMVKAMRKEREPMYPVRSFQNVDFGELVNKYELTNEENLLNSVDSVSRTRHILSMALLRVLNLINMS